MPKPKDGETRDEFLARCIPMLIDEGMGQKQAMAICSSMFDEKKGLFELDTSLPETNALKTISVTDDELRVANYIVLFGGRDLEWLRSGRNADGTLGDFFTPRTDFESPYTKAGTLYVDWEHGEGKRLDGNDAPGPDDILGVVDWKTARMDRHGLWVERVLNRRSEYVKMLETLIKEGLIGTSSEAIPAGVVRKPTGEIEKWPLKRDTLTVWPAEPRMLSENVLQSAKALLNRLPSLKTILHEEPQKTNDGGGSGKVENKHRILRLRAMASLLE